MEAEQPRTIKSWMPEWARSRGYFDTPDFPHLPAGKYIDVSASGQDPPGS